VKRTIKLKISCGEFNQTPPEKLIVFIYDIDVNHIACNQITRITMQNKNNRDPKMHVLDSRNLSLREIYPYKNDFHYVIVTVFDFSTFLYSRNLIFRIPITKQYIITIYGRHCIRIKPKNSVRYNTTSK